MISVVLIGSGNVSYHLANAFLKAENVNLVQVYARNIQQIDYLKAKTKITDNINELANADVYILAVSDDAISEVSSKITKKNAFVVHTSGATNIDKLKHNGRRGVFYMLQSFTKGKAINFDEVPFCLEAENEIDLKLLERLANQIGKKIYRINSQQREVLHMSAVFVNNFTNHLFKIGNDICSKNNVPFEILNPIIKETILKIEKMSPKDAQTGPARRKDEKTIKKHLSLLDENQQEIYKILTKSIQNEY